MPDDAGLICERLRGRGGQFEPKGWIGKALRSLQDGACKEGAPPFTDSIDILLRAKSDEIRLLHDPLQPGRL